MNTGNSLAQKTPEGKHIRDCGVALAKAVAVECMKNKTNKNPFKLSISSFNS